MLIKKNYNENFITNINQSYYINKNNKDENAQISNENKTEIDKDNKDESKSEKKLKEKEDKKKIKISNKKEKGNTLDKYIINSRLLKINKKSRNAINHDFTSNKEGNNNYTYHNQNNSLNKS